MMKFFFGLTSISQSRQMTRAIEREGGILSFPRRTLNLAERALSHI